jgi:hypothetical protein
MRGQKRRAPAADLSRAIVQFEHWRQGRIAGELLSRVVFRGPESGGVLQDSVGDDSSFENKNDLVMSIESSPTSAG